MSGPVIKHHESWSGHIAIASIFGVGAMFVWMLLNGAAKALTDCHGAHGSDRTEGSEAISGQLSRHPSNQRRSWLSPSASKSYCAQAFDFKRHYRTPG